jgi:hypothetical protein
MDVEIKFQLAGEENSVYITLSFHNHSKNVTVAKFRGYHESLSELAELFRGHLNPNNVF